MEDNELQQEITLQTQHINTFINQNNSSLQNYNSIIILIQKLPDNISSMNENNTLYNTINKSIKTIAGYKDEIIQFESGIAHCHVLSQIQTSLEPVVKKHNINELKDLFLLTKNAYNEAINHTFTILSKRTKPQYIDNIISKLYSINYNDIANILYNKKNILIISQLLSNSDYIITSDNIENALIHIDYLIKTIEESDNNRHIYDPLEILIKKTCNSNCPNFRMYLNNIKIKLITIKEHKNAIPETIQNLIDTINTRLDQDKAKNELVEIINTWRYNSPDCMNNERIIYSGLAPKHLEQWNNYDKDYFDCDNEWSKDNEIIFQTVTNMANQTTNKEYKIRINYKKSFNCHQIIEGINKAITFLPNDESLYNMEAFFILK